MLTCAALVFFGAASARADLGDLIAYADQLLYQGVAGPRFVQLVDQRYWQMYPAAKEHPGNRGMGAYVQEMHARGLRGRALADAIHAEQRYRDIPYGKPLPPGQAKKFDDKPMPPGQAKKYGAPHPGAKFNGPPGMKPKDKAALFGPGVSPGKGHGKGHKK